MRTLSRFGTAALLLALALPLLSAIRAERVVACTAVESREPVGVSSSFQAAAGELMCFSELTGAAGTAEVTHIWLKDGAELFRVTLPVRADRWRTWSKKRVSPGSWTVKVLAPGGEELGAVSFTVGG